MATRKGQVAVEFLMYAGLFLIIAMAAYVLTTITERGEVSFRESQMVNAFGYKFASAPTIAYKGGEGFTYDVSFPSKLENRAYNITYACVGNAYAEGRSCYVQIGWNGTYQEFNYPYVIAPAVYEEGASTACIDPVSSSTGSGFILYPEESNGHIYFRNVGIEGSNSYPTIELSCEVNP